LVNIVVVLYLSVIVIKGGSATSFLGRNSRWMWEKEFDNLGTMQLVFAGGWNLGFSVRFKK
jgi:hypothetical protein